ncbi:hypothetical protein [Planctomicrobium sp. SH527]|uniref:hypothetical protein n=1 Tax=Planctomicrobium sp. SH527 TaxID=3448123 RepID=UPI003F5C5025
MISKAVCFSLLASVCTVAQADDAKRLRGRPLIRGPVVLSSRIEMLDDSIALAPPEVAPTIPKAPANKPVSKGASAPGELMDRVREFGRTVGTQESKAVQAERLEPQSSKRSNGIFKVSLFSLFSGPNGEDLEDSPANANEPIPPAPSFDVIEDRPLPQPIPSVQPQAEIPYSFPPHELEPQYEPQYYGAIEGGDEACTTENGRAISGVVPQSDKKWCVLRWPGLSRMFKK